MVSQRLLVITLCASLLSACAGPGKISPQNRAAIHSLRCINPPQGAEASCYSDRTSEVAGMVGAQFGLVGGLVGGAIAASDINAGVQRWAPLTSGRQNEVMQLVRAQVEKEFVQSGKLRCMANGATDAQLEFKRIGYGVCHAGSQQFHVIIIAEVEMKKPDGKVIWRTSSSGKSNTGRTLQEYKQNPQLYADGLKEVAEALAAKLVSAYQS